MNLHEITAERTDIRTMVDHLNDHHWANAFEFEVRGDEVFERAAGATDPFLPWTKDLWREFTNFYHACTGIRVTR